LSCTGRACVAEQAKGKKYTMETKTGKNDDKSKQKKNQAHLFF
jgi:hypothetical protein